MKIWCLLNIDNDYHQPDNNLCAWWSKKPTTEQLTDAACGTGCFEENIERLLNGEEVKTVYASYRLKEIEEGTVN